MADGNYQRNNNGPKQERAKHSLNDFRFRLTGQRLEGAAKPCQLGFDIDRDGLKLTAFTNVEGDKDNGMIRATIPLADAMSLMVLLERAPRLQAGKHEELAIAGNVFDRQSNSRKMRHQANLKIGRHDNGVIYLSVASWDRARPPVVIDMLPSNFVRLVDPDGNPAPADKVSELWAVQWAKWLSQLFPLVLNSEYARLNADYLARSAGGGGGQGGNRGGQGGGNYNRGGNQGGGYGGGNAGGGAAPAASNYGGGGSGGGNDSFSFDGDDLPM
jgi:hypothetical protein